MRAQPLSTETFLQEAKKLYGDKYTYEGVECLTENSKVVVTCPKHGEFSVCAKDFLQGKKCKFCTKEEEFEEKLVAKFGNKFDCSKVVWQSSTIPVEVICPKHGSFFNLTNAILRSSFGCPQCQNDYYLEKEIAYRKEQLIEYINLREEREIIKQEGRVFEDTNYYLYSDEEIDYVIDEIVDRIKSLEKELAGDSYMKDTLPRSFVALDFETLYPQRVSACSIGMVKYIDGEIVDRYYSLIKPPFDYEGKCGVALTWIHGFTESMFDNERTFYEILPEMEAFAGNLPLVAHNCSVERACINDCSHFYGISSSLRTDDIFDTLTISRHLEKELDIYQEGPGTHSLDVVCKRFQIDTLSHHNALDDAEMCGNLMKKFIQITDNIKDFKNAFTYKNPEPDVKPQKKEKLAPTEIVESPFTDKTFIITGVFRQEREDIACKMLSLGAKRQSSISKKTEYVIAGEGAGQSKLQKIQELRDAGQTITILNQDNVDSIFADNFDFLK